MNEPLAPLPLRDDTMLGVCEALGEDFGFNPLLLRVPLAVMVIFAPVAVIAAYFAAGAVVVLSRLAFPDPRRPALPAAAPAAAATPEEEEPPLPLAA